MKTETGGSAYPIQPSFNEAMGPCPESPGVTILDWFAKPAMIEILRACTDSPADYDFKYISKKSYELAAAMIAEKQEREK